MRYHKKLLELFDELTVKVDRGDGLIISICGLCANSGIVNTRDTAIYGNARVGVTAPCICPNGRALKQRGKR